MVVARLCKILLATLAVTVALSARAAEAQLNWLDQVIYFVMPDRFDNGDASNDRGGGSPQGGVESCMGSIRRTKGIFTAAIWPVYASAWIIWRLWV